MTKLWKEKSNEKERIFIYLTIDPKGQNDVQGHMIFLMTFKLNGLSRFLWPICDSIQRIIREISAIESLNDVMFARPEVTSKSVFTK